MMCNLPINFLQTRRGSTNLVMHRRLAKFIDNRSLWLECELLKWLVKFFIFDMTTHFLAKGCSWLEMLWQMPKIKKLQHRIPYRWEHFAKRSKLKPNVWNKGHDADTESECKRKAGCNTRKNNEKEWETIDMSV